MLITKKTSLVLLMAAVIAGLILLISMRGNLHQGMADRVSLQNEDGSGVENKSKGGDAALILEQDGIEAKAELTADQVMKSDDPLGRIASMILIGNPEDVKISLRASSMVVISMDKGKRPPLSLQKLEDSIAGIALSSDEVATSGFLALQSMAEASAIDWEFLEPLLKSANPEVRQRDLFILMTNSGEVYSRILKVALADREKMSVDLSSSLKLVGIETVKKNHAALSSHELVTLEEISQNAK